MGMTRRSGGAVGAAMFVVSLVAFAATVQAAPQAGPAQAPDPPRGPTVYGFMQTHFRAARDTSGDGVVDATDFRVQRVRVGVKGRLNAWLSYQIEIDPRAPDVTGVLRDAFVSLQVFPHHELRVGQQKTQFGYENRESSSDLFVVNRAEVSDSLSRGVNLRDIGVGLIGHVTIGPRLRFEDALTVVNGAGLNVQADTTPKKNVWGRAGIRYRNAAGDLTVRAGVSGATGDFVEAIAGPVAATDERTDFSRLGLDAEIDHRLLFANAEFVRGTDHNRTTGESGDRTGYYLQVAGKTRWPVGPLARLDTLDDEFRRWTVGGYYGLPKQTFRVLVNYEYRERRDGARADDKFYVWTQVRF